MAIGGGIITPHYKRMMIFVDGTNFLVELFKEFQVDFRADKPPSETLAIAKSMIDPFFLMKGIVRVRKYWFSSYQGNDQDHDQLAKDLRYNGFEPVLFKKREGREKGVDIALAKEMLVNSFNQNFDLGLLIAGDEDYVGLVTEAKRYGPVIEGAFFAHGLSDKLRLALDQFYDIVEYSSRYINIEQTRANLSALNSPQNNP